MRVARLVVKYAIALVVPMEGIIGQQATPFPQSAENFDASLQYHQGKVVLPGGLATIDVPAGFRFLEGAQAKRLLVEGWHNPPAAAEGTLGALVPADVNPMSSRGWAMIITYDPVGYVSDSGAATADYGALLRDMQRATIEGNAARVKSGYPTMDLVGWATPPYYERATHKLYWAKAIRFGDQITDTTLNYNIRILGRRGVLVLNAVASLSDLAEVQASMRQVMGFVNFQDGHRYSDFVPGDDKVAAYGIGGLILGAVATKAGLFKLLLVFLLGLKKLFIAAVVGAGAWVSSLFRRRPKAVAVAALPAGDDAEGPTGPD